MARSFGRDQINVNILWGLDLAEMDIEAMREQQGFPLCEMGLDIFFVKLALGFIRREDHDHVSFLGSLGSGYWLKAVFPGKFIVGTAWALPDYYIYAGVAQVLGMGMPLASITYDRDCLALERTKICVLVIIDFHLFPSW